jgi:prepilin-type N-terminal cleavage/methylation domain-containing protein
MKPRARRGFTLTEALFAVALLAVVSGGVCTMFCSNNYGATLSGDQSVAMTDTQTALRSVTTDLCPATAFATPDHTGGLRVTYASGPAVEYYLDGTTLKRMVASTGNPTTTVITGLVSSTGLSLTYYDSSMSAIAGTMDSTKYGQAVAVNVTVQTNLAHSAFGQVSRTTRVVLRNKVS